MAVGTRRTADPSRNRVVLVFNSANNAVSVHVSPSFRGQGAGGLTGPVKFAVKGLHVVVMTPQNEFVAILRCGIGNGSVQKALMDAGLI
jgi:hypothetical protein